MRADADEMDESRIIQSTAWLEHIGGITMELGRVDDTLENRAATTPKMLTGRY